MRELDVLLNTFIDANYRDLDVSEQDSFDRLLDQSDVDLYAWLTGREVPKDPEFARFVRIIGRGSQ